MSDTGAAARGDEARRLIDESTRALVELVTVSAVELCALDGPRHLLFDEQVATAWGSLDAGARAAAAAATDVSVYWHRAGEDLHGLVVTVHGDGRTARLGRDGRSAPGLEHAFGTDFDEAGLRQVMADLFAVGRR